MRLLLLKRLGIGAATLAVVSLMIFIATRVLPGDAAEIILGESATADTLAAPRNKMGLDQPAWTQYLHWLAGMTTGDLGMSLAGGIDISRMVSERLRNTFVLAGSTALFSIPLSVALGLWSAMKPGGVLDRVVGTATMTLVSLPEFLVSTVLVLFFAVYLRWFPSIAYQSNYSDPVTMLWALSLPILTLSFFVGAQTVRMTRATILNVLSSDFIEMAILKGVPRRRIILRHALPNSIGPIANVVALALTYLVGGVLVVETIFAYPGLAKLMVEAVQTRDMPLVQVCAMIFCAAYVTLILLADMLQIMSNPRLRHPK